MAPFINVAKSERSGQPLVGCRNVDQHHPLTPSSAEEGNSKFPSFLRRGPGGGRVPPIIGEGMYAPMP